MEGGINEDAPFQKGDVLALCGPGVYHGCSVFVADREAVLRGTDWNFGFRQWGKDSLDGSELRHATEDDLQRLMKIELDGLYRAIESIKNLQRVTEVFRGRQNGG